MLTHSQLLHAAPVRCLALMHARVVSFLGVFACVLRNIMTLSYSEDQFSGLSIHQAHSGSFQVTSLQNHRQLLYEGQLVVVGR